jgi:hypothetical protein
LRQVVHISLIGIRTRSISYERLVSSESTR